MDSAPPRSAGSANSPFSSDRTELAPKQGETQDQEKLFKELSGVDIEDFWRDAEGDSVGLRKSELAEVLLTVGVRYNHGLAAGTGASRVQIASFMRSLQLRDLALAHACTLGRDAAWEQFVARFRESLMQTAISIAGSVAVGQELADSLYSELFGITAAGERRKSPLAYYARRGSLKGFLRATLAQRCVDYHRRSRRETPILIEDLEALPQTPTPRPDELSRLSEALIATLSALGSEDRFLLSAWFLDRRTLLDIGRILGVHEATVSRRLQRLTARLREELLRNLQLAGMSRGRAEETLGTDPRDIDINLRTFLQASQKPAFFKQGASPQAEQV